MAADSIWLDVLPALAKFGPALTKGTNQAATHAGKTAGSTWSKQFADSAFDGGSKAVVAELEAAAKQTQRVVADQTGKIQAARAAQRDAAAKTVLAEQALADAQAKGGDDSAKARAAALRLEAARERQTRATDTTERAEDALKAAQRENRTVTEQLEKATKDLSDEVEDQPSLWDRLAGSVSSAKDKIAGADDGLGSLVGKLAAAAGGAALFSEAFGTAMGGEDATAQLTVALDLTQAQAETAGAAAGALFSDAWAGSLDEAGAAVQAVMGSIPGLADASQAEIEKVAIAGSNLQSVFGIDVSESAAAAGLAIQNGLAGDGVEAMDLLTSSLQKVPESMRGEVLDAANEYGGVLSGLGLTGEQAFGLLASASEGGSIAVDKYGDSLKEFTIRATDMSTASVAAYDTLGLSAQDMSNDLLAGGDTAAGAMDTIVEKLLAIEDPATQANTAIALFGTPLEDLGVQKIPEFLTGLSDMNTGLGDVTGSSQEMADTLGGTTSSSIESLKNQFILTLSEGVAPLLGPVQSFLQWATDTPGVLQAVAIALGVVAVAWGVVTLVASPWLALGVGIAAVIGLIVLAVNNWGAITDWLKEKWEPIGAWLSENVFDPIKRAAGWVGDKFETVGAVVVETWDEAWTGLQAGWSWLDDHVFTPVKDGIGYVGDAFEAVPGIVRSAWNKIKEYAAKPVNFVIETVYTSGIKKTWDSIADAVGLDLHLPAISPIKFASGGVTPGYTPRQDVHHYWSPTGGALSLSGGEAIMVPEWTRAVGGPGAVARMNAAARGGQAFADGGVFGAVGDWIGNAASNVASFATKVANFLADPAQGVRDLIAAPMETLLSQVGGGQLGQLLVEVPRTVVEGIIGKAKSLFNDVLPRTVTAIGASDWTSPSQGPITSRYGPRWGAFHAGTDIAGGGPTFAAAAGQVADVGWNILGGRTGVGILLDHGGSTWTYYGHNPVGGPKVSAGQRVMMGQHIGYQGATGNVTGTHLHYEVHRGGIGSTVDPQPFMSSRGVTLGSAPMMAAGGGNGVAPRLLDTGGRIYQGLNLIENRTGRDELVLNPEQEGALAQALRGRRSERPLHIHTTEPISTRRLIAIERRADLLAGIKDEG